MWKCLNKDCDNTTIRKTKVCRKCGGEGRVIKDPCDVCDIGGNSLSHSVKHTKLKKLSSNNIMGVQAIPPTAKAVGILA